MSTVFHDVSLFLLYAVLAVFARIYFVQRE